MSTSLLLMEFKSQWAKPIVLQRQGFVAVSRIRKHCFKSQLSLAGMSFTCHDNLLPIEKAHIQ